MENAMLDLLGFALYLFIRSLVGLCQQAWWLVNGVLRHRKLCATADGSDAQHYDKSAELGKIWWRGKLHMLYEAGSQDFLVAHQGFVDPRVALKKGYSIYCITDTDAYFVRTPETVDIYSSDTHPLLYNSQFFNATHVLRMPIWSFHRLASEVGDPKVKVVNILMTARCGSTLLTQFFEALPRTRAISELDAFTNIATARYRTSADERRQLLRSMYRVSCYTPAKGEPGWDPDSTPILICIKQRSYLLQIMREIFEVTRNYDITHWFMYREPEPNVLSTARAFSCISMGLFFRILRRYTLAQYIFAHRFEYSLDLLTPREEWCRDRSYLRKLEAIHMYCIRYCHTCAAYLDNHNLKSQDAFSTTNTSSENAFSDSAGQQKIVALKYELLTKNPKAYCEKMFKICGIFDLFCQGNDEVGTCEKSREELLVDCVKAMQRDSQRGTFMSREAVAKRPRIQMTPTLRRELDAICKRMGVAPTLDTPLTLPGTLLLTSQEKDS